MTEFIAGFFLGVFGTLAVSLWLVLRMMEQAEPTDDFHP